MSKHGTCRVNTLLSLMKILQRHRPQSIYSESAHPTPYAGILYSHNVLRKIYYYLLETYCIHRIGDISTWEYNHTFITALSQTAITASGTSWKKILFNKIPKQTPGVYSLSATFHTHSPFVISIAPHLENRHHPYLYLNSKTISLFHTGAIIQNASTIANIKRTGNTLTITYNTVLRTLSFCLGDEIYTAPIYTVLEMVFISIISPTQTKIIFN